jgi:hypothetical protein
MSAEHERRPTISPIEAFPDSLGSLKKVAWPSPTAPQYWLLHGVLGPTPKLPTWALATMDGAYVSSEQVWLRPSGVTSGDLREWLEPQTGSEAARDLAATMATRFPILFTDGPADPDGG